MLVCVFLSSNNHPNHLGSDHYRGETHDRADHCIYRLFQKELTRNPRIYQYDIENSEALNLLRYKKGEQYNLHYDCFPPTKNNVQPISYRDGGQRVKTVLCYLNDSFTGGETEFPRHLKKITPKQGTIVCFKNALNSGQPDPSSLHASLPVKEKEKWVLTKWIRESKTQNGRLFNMLY